MLAAALGKTNSAPRSVPLSSKSINLDLEKQLPLAKPEWQQEMGVVEASNGGLREMSQGLRLIGRPTEKCDAPGKGFHETGPWARLQEGKMSSRSKHYGSAASTGLGLPLLRVSWWATGLVYISKYRVCKTISIMSAEYARHFRMINFKSLMQLVFSLMIKNMVTSTFSLFTHQALWTISAQIKRTQCAVQIQRIKRTARHPMHWVWVGVSGCCEVFCFVLFWHNYFTSKVEVF